MEKSSLPLKQVIIPRDVLDIFCSFANRNTVAGVETLGLLCGVKTNVENDDSYVVTHLVIPDQHGTFDGCTMTDNGELELSKFLQESSQIQLGWIHTHPYWDVFMSSVDLHQQRHAQKCLPEMFAIVVNPSSAGYGPREANEACYGLYHLTSLGMEVITNCQEKDHHSQCSNHDHSLLYEQAYHCQLKTWRPAVDFDLNIEDLRRHTYDPELQEYGLWRERNYGSAPAVTLHSKVSSPTDGSQSSTSPVSTALQGAQIAVTEHVPPDEFPVNDELMKIQSVQKSRPELGVTSFVNAYSKFGVPDPATQVIHLLDACAPYIEREEICAAKMVEHSDILQSLCQLENSLIDLGATGLAVDICILAILIMEYFMVFMLP